MGPIADKSDIKVSSSVVHGFRGYIVTFADPEAITMNGFVKIQLMYSPG